MIPYRIVPDGLSALCSPSLVSRVISDMDKTTADELIERNHRLLARAAALCAHVRQINQIAEADLARAEQAQVMRHAAWAPRAAARARLRNPPRAAASFSTIR